MCPIDIVVGPRADNRSKDPGEKFDAELEAIINDSRKFKLLQELNLQIEKENYEEAIASLHYIAFQFPMKRTMHNASL